MKRNIIKTIALTVAILLSMTGNVSAYPTLDQKQWTANSSYDLTIDSGQGHKTFDQDVTAGMTGLLTNVEIEANVTSDRVYFYVDVPGRNEGDPRHATFVTNLAMGSGAYNIDVSAAGIHLHAGDVFSIGLIGLEGDNTGSFAAAVDTNPYAGGALYYRYGATGYLGLGYDDDMKFRTYIEVSPTPTLDQEQWTANSSYDLTIDSGQGHKTFDQDVTAGKTGLLTNVEIEANVTSDRVYFYVDVPGRNEGDPLDATFVTNLAMGSGVYNIDVSAAGIHLHAGEVFSIGLVGLEGDNTGSFAVAIDTNPYAGGALYYRYGATGWLGLGYDDDMKFRTYIVPEPCAGDFDHDGDVDGTDLSIFAAELGRIDCP